METLKQKLLKTKWDGSLSSPQYQLTYGRMEKPAVTKARSQAIRRLLLGDASVLVELDSALLALPDIDREAAAMKFRDGLKTLDLDFRHRTSQITGRSSFLAKLIKSETESHQIFVLVEAVLWQTENFETLLPAQGVRYYCLPKGDAGIGLLDEIFQGKLIKSELIDRFDIILYDVAIFGQMGIISAHKSYEELQELLTK